MVIYAEVDKFLAYEDYARFYEYDFKWPWTETHFIRTQNCPGCGNLNDVSQGASHFIITNLLRPHLKALMENPSFWCPLCTFSVYDHYINDECTHCSN